MADHADLGAAARIAGGGLDLDDAVVNLGDFLGEQLLHEVRMRAAEEDLRPAILAANVEDQAAGAVADADDLARDLLVAADDALGPAEVDDDMAELDPLDDPGDDLADPVLELLILALALGVADLLEDHLLGGLGSDPAELDRGQRIDDEVADIRAGLKLLRILEAHLLEIILDLFDHLDDAPQAKIAGRGIELGADVVLGAVAGAGGALDRIFHRLDDDHPVDQFLARDGIRDRDQLRLVRGNGAGGRGFGCHGQSCPSASSVCSISSAPSVESGAVAAISRSVRTSLAE